MFYLNDVLDVFLHFQAITMKTLKYKYYNERITTCDNDIF